MRLRSWPILAFAFCSLLGLLVVAGLGALQRARQIYSEVSSLHSDYQAVERSLNRVRTDIHLSGVLVRDYLLDRSELTAERYREELRRLRADLPVEFEQLGKVIGAEERGALERLRAEIDGYWDALDPLFEWTPSQKLALSTIFLRRQVLPRRDAALEIAREIRELNEANLAQQQRAIAQKEEELPQYVRRMLLATVFIGFVVAVASVYRITRLEQRSDRERARVEVAEGELRRLSQQLVKAQEEERRAISRELHDEVGQMLTAQRMELRNLQQVSPSPEAQKRLEDMARISEQALRTVRDIAMGLRPSMLDDLGLGPAIEWQARDFSRRYGIPAEVQIDGNLEDLPDAHRTCVYRVIQEALTNCARHSRATEVRVAVHGRPDGLTIAVRDDGVGFEPARSRTRGLGLIGIEERVKELGGAMAVFSQPGKGTSITAEIPLGAEVPAHA